MNIPTVEAARLAVAPYLLWLKLAALILIAALIFGAGWKAGASLTEGRWLRAAEKQVADYQASLARAREAERASYAKSQEVSRGLQTDLAAIRAERDRLRNQPARVVRVLVPAAGPSGLPADRPAAGGRDGAPAGAAPQPGEAGQAAGFDIGRPIYEIVDDSDEREAELAARLRRCQEWAASVPHISGP